MADAVGFDGMHSIIGYTCDYCGKGCNSDAQELNALDCTFAQCPSSAAVYHQDCLEKYLKSIRLEKSRKTGFKCPRGSGKGTTYSDCCPGKINKSHPIHIRNDDAKKRRKAQPLPVLERPKPLKEKPRVKDVMAKAKPAKDSKPERAARKTVVSLAKPVGVPVVSAVSREAVRRPTPVPTKPLATGQKEQLAAAAAAVKRELGIKSAQLPTASKAPAKDSQTLEEYEKGRLASQASWGKSTASALPTTRHRASGRHQASAPIAVPAQTRSMGDAAPSDQGPSPHSWSAVLQMSGSAPQHGSHQAGGVDVTSSARRPAQPAASGPGRRKVQQMHGALTGPKGAVLQRWGPDSSQAGAGSREDVVGGVFVEDDRTAGSEGDARASRAHRKNQRRAERKSQARQISTDVAPVSSGLRATDSFASSEVLSEATSDGLGDDSCIAYPAEDILEKQEDGCDLSSSSDEEDVAQEADETDEAESDSHDSSLASDQAPAPEDSLGARSLQAVWQHQLQQGAAAMGLLGFQDWQCLAAMAHACGDLQEALVLLLEGRLDTPGQAEALLLRSHAQAVRDRAGEQLDAMQALQVSHGLDADTLHQLVLDANGDIVAALADMPQSLNGHPSATSSEAASTDSAPYAEPQPASSLGDPIISWGRHAAPQALATSADPLAPSQRLAEPASEASWASGGDAPPAVSLQGPPASGTQSLPAAAGHLLPSNAPAPGEPHARHPSAPRLTRLKPEELFQLHAAALGQAQLSGGMKGAVPTTPQLQALQALPSSQYSPLEVEQAASLRGSRLSMYTQGRQCSPGESADGMGDGLSPLSPVLTSRGSAHVAHPGQDLAVRYQAVGQPGEAAAPGSCFSSNQLGRDAPSPGSRYLQHASYFNSHAEDTSTPSSLPSQQSGSFLNDSPTAPYAFQQAPTARDASAASPMQQYHAASLAASSSSSLTPYNSSFPARGSGAQSHNLSQHARRDELAYHPSQHLGAASGSALTSPNAALLAAAAVTADSTPSMSHLARGAEQTELEALVATLMCR